MHEKKYKIVIDNTVWISSLFGGVCHRLLSEIIDYKNVTIFVCTDLIDEFLISSSYPRVSEKVSQKNIKSLFLILKNRTKHLKLSSVVKINRDLKDDYLLALSKDSYSDYLLTYDYDLLDMEKYKKTKIIEIKDFIKILRTE
jgi:putative PIN family toxin of toxin-antitoxin system